MSSFLCFLCHSTVNADMNEEIREKYREVVGMHLCMDSHLCYICCHVLNKLWLFRAVCLKRSLEYPVLFSEKGTLNLQRSDLEFHTICSEEMCGQYHARNSNLQLYQISHQYVDNQYAELEDERIEYDEYAHQDEEIVPENKSIQDTNAETYEELSAAVQDNTIKRDEELETNYMLNKDNEYAHDIYDSNLNTDNNETGDFDDVNETCETENEFAEGIENTEVVEGNNIENNKSVFEEDLNKCKKKKKSKKSKKNAFEKIILSLEEQKAELDKRRKEKKYIESEFKCYNCALGFLFKDTYQTHMMRHEESNGEFRCATCTLRFASPAVLRAHTAQHAERYACAECDALIGPNSRKTHSRRCWRVAGDEVSCHLCGGMFQDGAGLQQHLKRFHQTKTSNRVYPCSVCGNTYYNQAAVRTHMLKHINKKFSCTECDSTFSSPYTLAQHKIKKHTSASTEQYYCEICDVSYSSRKSLLAHKRNALNHQTTIFECPICSRVCPNQRSLASHMESVHSGNKHACGLCPARCTNRKSLLRHVRMHSNKIEVKEAVCHLCGNTFKGNNKLNRHLREVCEKAKIEEEFASLYEQECMNPG